MNSPQVSVIVPVYNCAQTIALTLKALCSQTYPGVEIVVVDDGSTDQTKSIVKSFDNVQYVYQSNAGPASARNHGARISRGEFLFFTDADCIPQTNWIEKALKRFEENIDIGVVSGSYGIANPHERLARCVYQEILFRHEFLLPVYPKVFGSYNFGIRRKIFEDIGGFNEEYRRASGEDNDLSYKVLKAGHKIRFDPMVLVDHFHPVKVFKYLSEQYRHGFWRVKMYLEHPEMAQGDDYTFWKDPLEIGVVLLLGIFLILSLLNPIFFQVFIFFVFGLWILEFGFCCLMPLSFFDMFFFSQVLFLRSFARAFGFSSGFYHFLLQKR
jgi:glycosyltransferase involved in cell wall biosynthesis